MALSHSQSLHEPAPERSAEPATERPIRTLAARPVLPPVFPSPAGASPDAVLLEEAQGFLENARSRNTRRAYESAWTDFCRWCDLHGARSLPSSPGTLALFLTDRARTLKPQTLALRIAGISAAHEAAGYPSPSRSSEVQALWRGIRRSLGVAGQAKRALAPEDLRKMVESLPGAVKTRNPSARRLLLARDRALLLVCFCGAFRRSEVAALTVEDLAFGKNGLLITVRRSKTDQEGRGRSAALPFWPDPDLCAVRSLRAWMKAAGVKSGPVFRHVDRDGRIAEEALSGHAVWTVVKRTAAAAGLDASEYGAHSLRSGFVSAAAEAGASPRSISDQTGHKSLSMVLHYTQRASVWKDGAAGKIRI